MTTTTTTTTTTWVRWGVSRVKGVTGQKEKEEKNENCCRRDGRTGSNALKEVLGDGGQWLWSRQSCYWLQGKKNHHKHLNCNSFSYLNNLNSIIHVDLDPLVWLVPLPSSNWHLLVMNRILFNRFHQRPTLSLVSFTEAMMLTGFIHCCAETVLSIEKWKWNRHSVEKSGNLEVRPGESSRNGSVG